MANVSKENLLKVEGFFVEQAKITGTNRTEATVNDISVGAGVALATAHKALKELSARGVLTVIKPSSRRIPITYIYQKDIEGFEIAQSKDEQIAYLKELNEKKDDEIAQLNAKIRQLELANRNSSAL